MKYLLLTVLAVALFGSEFSSRAIIVSLDKTIISNEIAGKIISFPKQEGDSFKRGELLTKIECDVYEAQRNKVAKEAEISKLQWKKNKKLYDFNSIGEFEVLMSEQQYKQDLAELNIVNINVKRCEIFAPFDGKIVSTNVNKYQSVKPQQELFEIVGSNRLEAKVVVPATWLQWLKKGINFQLIIDETGESVKARVRELGAVVDPVSQTIDVRATIGRHKINTLAGMSATAYFEVK